MQFRFFTGLVDGCVSGFVLWHLKGGLGSHDVLAQQRTLHFPRAMTGSTQSWDRLMNSHYTFWLCWRSFVQPVCEHGASCPPGRERKSYLHFVHYVAQVISPFPISWLLFFLIHPPVEPFPRPFHPPQTQGLQSFNSPCLGKLNEILGK